MFLLPARARVAALAGLLWCGACSSDPDGGVDDIQPPDELYDGPLQYRSLVQYENFPFEDFPVLMYMPEDPVAVVWLFHGTNGSVGFAKKIETIATSNELIGAGFGVIATESDDRVNGKWSTDDSNPATSSELGRLFRLRDEVIATTDMTQDTPSYTVGFSGGGSMATHFTKVLRDQGIPYRAAHANCSSGRADGAGDIPIIWSIAVNDPQQFAEDTHESRVASGFPSELYHVQEVPIDSMFFTKNPSMDEGRSRKAHDEMVRLQLIDDTGERIVPIEEAENWLSTYEREADVPSASLRTEEIRVGWAMHRMNGTHARKIRDFFLAHL